MAFDSTAMSGQCSVNSNGRLRRRKVSDRKRLRSQRKVIKDYGAMTTKPITKRNTTFVLTHRFKIQESKQGVQSLGFAMCKNRKIEYTKEGTLRNKYCIGIEFYHTGKSINEFRYARESYFRFKDSFKLRGIIKVSILVDVNGHIYIYEQNTQIKIATFRSLKFGQFWPIVLVGSGHYVSVTVDIVMISKADMVDLTEKTLC